MYNKIALIFCILVTLLTFSFSTLCRDGSYCPGLQTCCLTPSGVGCCPYENAVCCGDGIHCCPWGYQCGHGTCFRTSPNSDFFGPEIKAASIATSENKSKSKGLPSMDGEIEYILHYCISNQPIESIFKEMIINCKDKKENYDKSQNCKLALLYTINEGMIKSTECYDKIKELIKRLD